MKYLDWLLYQLKLIKLSNVIRFPIEKRLEQIKKEKKN
tara:strand:+ start:149 stop:262 length:114 start_codon:yes stop_codon:yes gene_type:complete